MTLSDIERTYGNDTITSGGYSATAFEGLVNGDEISDIINQLVIDVKKDNAVTGETSGKVTNNAGKYTWNADVKAKKDNQGNSLLTNYIITSNDSGINKDGDSIVNKAKLNVALSEVAHYEGSADLVNNTSYDKTITGATNGDDLSKATLTHIKDGALTADGKGTNGVGSYDWTAELSGDDAGARILSNYEIVMGTGVSTVLERPIHEKDTEQTRYFFRDAPWDRNEDARERKAQLHFIAGGLRL